MNRNKDQQNGEASSARNKAVVKKWGIRLAIAAMLIAAGVYFTPKMLYSFSHESTDDAYVSGTIVPVSAEVKGKVVKVFVEDNQPVKAGAPLLEIYSADYANEVKEKGENRSILSAQKTELETSVNEAAKSLDRAHANLDAARADEAFAANELQRYDALYKEALVSQSRYDRMKSEWRVAKAREEAGKASVAEAAAALETAKARLVTQNSRIKEAAASLDTARLDLRRTTVTAPISGRITKKNVDPGKYVQVGQPLLSIVDDKDVWVVANFKETQLKEMRVGQPVDIDVDAYAGRTFKGRVESFQSGTGAVFSLLPPENATGNFVKVVQRMPVKIVLDAAHDPDHPLWPGLSVTPHVDISVKMGAKLKQAARSE